MPSPRAILNDIHDLKLDPKKNHDSTSKSGRLKNPTVPQKLVVDKPGLVFLKEDNSIEEKNEDVLLIEEEKVEEVKSEEVVASVAVEPAKVSFNAASDKQKKKQSYQKKNSYNN